MLWVLGSLALSRLKAQCTFVYACCSCLSCSVHSCAGDSSTTFPETLQLLNVEENQLSDWSEVMKLKYLPRYALLMRTISKLFKTLTPVQACCLTHNHHRTSNLVYIWKLFGHTCLYTYKTSDIIYTLARLCFCLLGVYPCILCRLKTLILNDNQLTSISLQQEDGEHLYHAAVHAQCSVYSQLTDSLTCPVLDMQCIASSQGFPASTLLHIRKIRTSWEIRSCTSDHSICYKDAQELEVTFSPRLSHFPRVHRSSEAWRQGCVTVYAISVL